MIFFYYSINLQNITLILLRYNSTDYLYCIDPFLGMPLQNSEPYFGPHFPATHLSAQKALIHQPHQFTLSYQYSCHVTSHFFHFLYDFVLDLPTKIHPTIGPTFPVLFSLVTHYIHCVPSPNPLFLSCY